MVKTDRPAIKTHTKQQPQNAKRSVGSRENQINVGGPAYLCPTTVGAERASGAKRVTLRGTFSTSHVDFSMPNLYLCQLCLCSKSASGVYPITLRGSFSTSHFVFAANLRLATTELFFEVPSPRVACLEPNRTVRSRAGSIFQGESYLRGAVNRQPYCRDMRLVEQALTCEPT